ncbi:carbon-nitrogen family hydrolase [Staphylococcus massiliensis]|uniref:carbon-nitrogen family hydrolase n=1 Tax=Staphylococcus massiliensis TaxID=555791 RepID=UPI0002DFFBFF|nr:carbon-nitrogen family hydrolase [Staphylococcus massiliensis]MCG3399891.1 carbon-nitrogen family hydrolase [Staphylococcus massiliensis]MCG3402585.1 carbon-nitrogen family hydrolase [Staphylococcus massiliensis]MCG3413078.1 carbon-nitrogen family hydrolase [Staphylococcus massiliensis]PNZ98361.1 carbon-nitrogen family hydrolase [Staphylococcus massiliensis CCUG 55927]
MKVQLFQFKIEAAQFELNKEKIKDLFESKLDAQTEVVVLPEMWNNGYALEALDELADENLQESKAFIAQLAQMHNVTIVAGSVANKVDGHIYNTSFTVNSDGEILNQYDKIHLVPMLDEPKFLTGGTKMPQTFQLKEDVRASQIVCYDLRFPELNRSVAQHAAITFYVAQWPLARIDHWIKLLQARAIENNMYVVGCNACGEALGTTYGGNSCIINPNGDIVKSLDTNEGHIVETLNLSEVERQRQQIPVLDNLRNDLY